MQIIYIIKDNEKLLVEDEDDNSLSEDNNDENIENNLEIIVARILQKRTSYNNAKKFPVTPHFSTLLTA
ncbi:hypothetical protein GLOIN_2v1788388 [Rhizophagus irregularis DAOM 181602=DAOM 197198]|uniref:Uncharacterized protein n=1 Tax=Rhizophagus irregularis (strain DAOM 181602 / DAOM 197198 / MUCL 43194) TaxID=747089 RepID=A0A2P4P3S4_RHIID|nr:hypothetical protein GLOIN_2v1788388 [Rhizophagus irregularis DAOM 181602=DAOM 197198]POG60043.1 hypothetical protein GLOIN_2v1788388 [Rhizophagus irregularis DAOM 181602=DAOM 197198]GET60631.1 hypothetical protein GLOIN_2v1788388 [Rhizophagus irregularis DAOM 181602=DAOM 197198]|eukprot:XP_025166909.1 hypothetical protein GLOIN_2v1788388 [Rhizophagus irregularis DAOM 181602=DAOM 197198]